MKCVETIKMFIFAEITGNQDMYLHATSLMLNIFAATENSNYADCFEAHSHSGSVEA